MQRRRSHSADQHFLGKTTDTLELGSSIVKAGFLLLRACRSSEPSRRGGDGVLHVADTEANLAFDSPCRAESLLPRIVGDFAQPLLHRAQQVRGAAFELVPVQSNLRVDSLFCLLDFLPQVITSDSEPVAPCGSRVLSAF